MAFSTQLSRTKLRFPSTRALSKSSTSLSSWCRSKNQTSAPISSILATTAPTTSWTKWVTRVRAQALMVVHRSRQTNLFRTAERKISGRKVPSAGPQPPTNEQVWKKATILWGGRRYQRNNSISSKKIERKKSVERLTVVLRPTETHHRRCYWYEMDQPTGAFIVLLCDLQTYKTKHQHRFKSQTCKKSIIWRLDLFVSSWSRLWILMSFRAVFMRLNLVLRWSSLNGR